VKAAKIPLIDDDVELLDMLKSYMEQEGFAVTATDVASTGVAEALSGHYGLVALDVMMPHMNGIEVLREIRTVNVIPVLMLTAKGDDADRIVGLELGADDYVAKPCTPRELVARIRAILRRTRVLEGIEETPAVIGLAVAALLAWYVSKPIRCLRRALNAAAHGDLDVRIGNVGRRRDELADLGRDFDITAARAKLLMDGQRRLLHEVSHELRSPLARLQVAVGLVRQHPRNVEAAINRVERECIRMDALIDELLTLSRLEAGIVNRLEERIDLAELVREVVADATLGINARPTLVTFDVRVDSLQLVQITGNAELLHLALDNVVRNSVRNTPSGGQVHIAVNYEALRHEVRLMIADEGPGFGGPELASMFEPFFRGRATNTTSGHGLGLAITHRVIQSHGGRVSASNRAGAQSVGLRQSSPNGACSTKESGSRGAHSGSVYGRLLGGPLDEHSVAIVPDSPHFSPL
jgi:signal transduction histidine kinase